MNVSGHFSSVVRYEDRIWTHGIGSSTKLEPVPLDLGQPLVTKNTPRPAVHVYVLKTGDKMDLDPHT